MEVLLYFLELLLDLYFEFLNIIDFSYEFFFWMLRRVIEVLIVLVNICFGSLKREFWLFLMIFMLVIFSE